MAFNESQQRDDRGRWSAAGANAASKVAESHGRAAKEATEKANRIENQKGVALGRQSSNPTLGEVASRAIARNKDDASRRKDAAGAHRDAAKEHLAAKRHTILLLKRIWKLPVDQRPLRAPLTITTVVLGISRRLISMLWQPTFIETQLKQSAGACRPPGLR